MKKEKHWQTDSRIRLQKFYLPTPPPPPIMTLSPSRDPLIQTHPFPPFYNFSFLPYLSSFIFSSYTFYFLPSKWRGGGGELGWSGTDKISFWELKAWRLSFFNTDKRLHIKLKHVPKTAFPTRESILSTSFLINGGKYCPCNELGKWANQTEILLNLIFKKYFFGDCNRWSEM